MRGNEVMRSVKRVQPGMATIPMRGNEAGYDLAGVGALTEATIPMRGNEFRSASCPWRATSRGYDPHEG